MADSKKVTLIADEPIAVLELDRQTFQPGEEFTVSAANGKTIVEKGLAHYKVAADVSASTPVKE